MNQERRCDGLAGRIRIGGEIWVALALAVLGAIYGYGQLNSSVASQADRVAKLEARSDQLQSIAADVAALKAQMAILVDAEQRREARESRP